MKTLEQRLKGFICMKLNPIDFAYSNLYYYFLNKGYKMYEMFDIPQALMSPSDEYLVRKVAVRDALKYARMYEKWIFRPIFGAYCRTVRDDNDTPL